MMFNYTKDEEHRIIKRFGRAYLERSKGYLETYASKWRLDNIRLVQSFSANLVFCCESELYGDGVLKIAPDPQALLSEYRTIEQYHGAGFCRLFSGNPEEGILLEERIEPGNTLREEEGFDTRLAVFAGLYSGLYEPPKAADCHPTYEGWVRRITDYMSNQESFRGLYEQMLRARELMSRLMKDYDRRMLLHGDFHHDNILMSRHGGYKIIDPKGVIGDPVFDTGRFVMNEFFGEIVEGDYDRIEYIFSYLDRTLGIDAGVLRQCFFIEATMAACWWVEDTSGEENGFVDDVPALADFAANVLSRAGGFL